MCPHMSGTMSSTQVILVSGSAWHYRVVSADHLEQARIKYFVCVPIILVYLPVRLIISCYHKVNAKLTAFLNIN